MTDKAQGRILAAHAGSSALSHAEACPVGAPSAEVAAGAAGYVVVYGGSGPATCHTLLEAATTVCGRKLVKGRGVEFSRERPPGAKACYFCNG